MVRRLQFAAPRWDRIAVVCIAIGAVLRVLFGLIVHPPTHYIFSDMLDYFGRAQHLAAGGPMTRWDALLQPGTHLLLALPLKFFGSDVGPDLHHPSGPAAWAAAVLWCGLSIAVPWLAWRFARQLLSPAAAAITAGLCAFSPLFITYGGYFTSEIPSLAFMLAALWAAAAATRATGRKAALLALLAGVLGGAAVAVRPPWLLNILVVALVLWLTFRTRLVPVATFVLGVVLALAPVVAYTSTVAHRLNGISENGGVNFFLGHCDVQSVTTWDKTEEGSWTNAVAGLLHRGKPYHFENRTMEDEPFFYQLGWDCIKHEGPHHIMTVARNVADLTITTIPWPQVVTGGAERDTAQAANLLYCALLPWIVIESLFLISRRRRAGAGPLPSEAIVLMHLACVVVVAIIFFGDPRFRFPYDAFGFALLGALLADRFQLDKPDPDPAAPTKAAPKLTRAYGP